MTIKRKFWTAVGHSLWRRTILLLVLLIIFCCSFPHTKLRAEPSQNSSVKVFFSPPVDLNSKLAAYIDDAQKSIKGCFYVIKSEEVAFALIKAHLRGVKIQIVIDEGRLFAEDSFYPKLKNFGLVRKDMRTSGLMHNKFCIIDEEIVWTGSYNPNPYAIYENNDAVVIKSAELANIYTQEFEKLWAEEALAGEECKHMIKLGKDMVMDVYFSPEDGKIMLNRMLELLEEAESSIYFAEFTITHPEVAEVLMKKARKGVDVKGIMEHEQMGEYSKYSWFELMNMDVAKDKNYCFAFHHKFFIIDKRIVITGSLNPTRAGFEKNRENVLIINSPPVAKRYLKYFQSIPK